MHVGDVVTVVKGAAADRSGTVKYVFRQFLFLHARRALLVNNVATVAGVRAIVTSTADGKEARSLSARCVQPLSSPGFSGVLMSPTPSQQN